MKLRCRHLTLSSTALDATYQCICIGGVQLRYNREHNVQPATNVHTSAFQSWTNSSDDMGIRNAACYGLPRTYKFVISPIPFSILHDENSALSLLRIFFFLLSLSRSLSPSLSIYISLLTYSHCLTTHNGHVVMLCWLGEKCTVSNMRSIQSTDK